MRDEHERLLTGEGCYAADVNLPGQAWLRVVRSDVAHGRLTGVDATEALELPGVLAVLAAADVDGEVPTIPIRLLPYPGMEQRLQPVLATDRVRYVGEPVAVVVAEDPYTAEDAAELVAVDIEPLPAAVDVRDPAPEPLWDDPLDNLICRYRAQRGDVDEVFAAAAVVVEGDFAVQRHTGLPLETRGLIARWEADGSLHLWGITKYVHFSRRTIAGFFGVDPDTVVCHHIDVGGMFGPRGEVYPEDFLVPWAARVCGRPVKWVEDRREHLLAINHSREQHHRFAIALDASGRFLAFRDEILIDAGAYPRPIGGRLTQLAIEALPGPYQWDALAVTCTSLATTKAPVGTMRGPSSFESNFVRERAIDLAAAQLGVDPVELRLANLIDSLPHRVDLGPEMEAIEYDTGDYVGVAQQALTAAGLPALRTEVAERRRKGEFVGLGVGFFVDHSGLGKFEHVGVELLDDGTFRVATSASDVGQGLEAMVRQVAGDRLGVPANLVSVVSNDSRAQGKGNGTFASRSTVFVGSATHDGAGKIRDQARLLAAERLGLGASTLKDAPDGFIAGDQHVHWKDLAPLAAEGVHQMDHPTFGFGLHLAVVCVDAVTCGLTVEQLHVAYDCGRAVDRGSVLGQLRGATIHGLGGSLLEELPYDESGQPLSTTFMDYLLPTASEAPDVTVHLFESEPVPRNPLGAKGVGEAGVMAVAPALANAVADALSLTGTQLTTLPLRADIIAQLLPTAQPGFPPPATEPSRGPS
jgi:aerobic carbon-monoxide dehydrogenase large subunit